MEQIISLQNKWIKYIKSLEQKKQRDKEKSFLLEGIRLLEEALRTSWPLQFVVYSDKLEESERGKRLLLSLKEKSINCFGVAQNILDKMGNTQTSQGILAVARQKDWLIEFPQEKALLWVLVDGVQDPGNLGTIIRTAHASGADAVFLTKGTVDLYSPKTVRSTMGSLFYLPIVKVEDWSDFVQLLHDKSIKLLVADLQATTYCFEQDYTQSIIICLGNEGAGPSAEAKNVADLLVKIPMPGNAESLNVAVAGGILLYEASRQRLSSCRETSPMV